MIILSYLHLLEKLAIVIFILSYLALNPELSYLIRMIFVIILPNSGGGWNPWSSVCKFESFLGWNPWSA